MSRPLRLLAVAMLLAASSAGAQWRSHGAEIPLEGDGHVWTVRAKLNDRVSGQFLLDTGASVCVLAPATAKRLDLEETGQDVELRTANGVVRAPLVRVRSIQVGRKRAEDVMAVVHPAVSGSLDGVLGLSFLNTFDSYSIDARNHTLRLED
jgi:clan AA aspartic protease (TIGR02281 family)